MTTNLTDSAPVTDDDLDHLIWGLERHGNLKRTLAALKELRELRKAKGVPAYYVLSDDDGIEINTVDEFSCGRRGGQPLYAVPPAQGVPDSAASEMLKRLAVIMSGSDAPGEIRSLTVTAQSLVDRCKQLADRVKQ